MSQVDRAKKKSVSKRAKAYAGTRRSGGKETKSVRKAKTKEKRKTTSASRRLNDAIIREIRDGRED